MRTFRAFITEDNGVQLFHKDIGIPPMLLTPLTGLRLRYGRHAQEAAMHDGIRELPVAVPPAYTVFEVESTYGKATKWGIRFPLSERPEVDICIVLLPDGFVKTVWVNHRSDKHKTLKRWLYTSPREYRSN